MIKFALYAVILPCVVWALDSVNLAFIFKKNKIYQARIVYIILVFSFSYLLVGFFYELLTLF